MNKRTRNKRADIVQKSFDVIAEYLAISHPEICFFIGPSYGERKEDRFEIHSSNSIPFIISKQVNFKKWRDVTHE